jgi:hypothetical protein
MGDEEMPGPPVIYRPSGQYWIAWQKRYFPNSIKTSDLKGQFRTGVEAFIKALRAAGATVTINETYRSKQAHYLFRWSYKIAKGTARPKDPPPFTGIHIQWDHGKSSSSVRGAQEMVNGFGLVHEPGVTTRHFDGRAIDMTITWSKPLRLQRADGNFVNVPSIAAKFNTVLHDVGATYGVKKLKKDGPHWSEDGH